MRVPKRRSVVKLGKTQGSAFPNPVVERISRFRVKLTRLVGKGMRWSKGRSPPELKLRLSTLLKSNDVASVLSPSISKDFRPDIETHTRFELLREA
jgi:hypothetical protein